MIVSIDLWYYDYRQELDALQHFLHSIFSDENIVECEKTLTNWPDKQGKFALIFSQFEQMEFLILLK